MDHWHAESLLIRMISGFAVVYSVFFNLRQSGNAQVANQTVNLHYDSAPCTLLLTSARSEARPPPSLPVFSSHETGRRSGGRGPSRLAPHPHLVAFTLYCVCILCFSSPSLPSLLPTAICSVFRRKPSSSRPSPHLLNGSRGIGHF